MDEPIVEYERAAEFVSTYANSVILKSKAWDLQIIFGQIDKSTEDSTIIKQNIAVTISWSQAKSLLYWLGWHVGSAEIQAGAIPIHPNIIPSIPELSPDDPTSGRLHELALKLLAELQTRTI